jgi:hypothetical protein
MALLQIVEFTDHVLPLLGHKALSSLESTSNDFREAIHATGGWSENFRYALPSFNLSKDFTDIAAPGMNFSSLRRLKELVGTLQKATLAPDLESIASEHSPIEQLHSLVFAERLAGKISQASAEAEAHRRKGGVTSKTLISRIRFPDVSFFPSERSPSTARTTSSAAFAGAHFWPSREDTTLRHNGHVWRVSIPVPFLMPRPVPSTSSCCSAASYGKDHGACAVDDEDFLLLQLAWRGNDVMLRIISLEASTHDDWGELEYVLQNGQRNRCVAVDICAVNERPLLRSMSTHATIDGAWQEINGISAALMKETQLAQVLEQGLLSVISVRDCFVEDARWTPVLAHALHLEMCSYHH